MTVEREKIGKIGGSAETRKDWLDHERSPPPLVDWEKGKRDDGGSVEKHKNESRRIGGRTSQTGNCQTLQTAVLWSTPCCLS
jgi:hypothetical protein